MGELSRELTKGTWAESREKKRRSTCVWIQLFKGKRTSTPASLPSIRGKKRSTRIDTVPSRITNLSPSSTIPSLFLSTRRMPWGTVLLLYLFSCLKKG
ncbi:hypothetical protein HPP92_017677 [Vanilla planifolia]|uniref:Uncharacterized protein n=1 Tax=Vanilla planifolia TaxID=51239 RepID=A0A835QBB4_VANPL|nr:hypothetical protein HPP92_017677 [Vanilla planifolia]